MHYDVSVYPCPYPSRSTYISEPFLEDVEPVALQDVLLHHTLVLAILLEEDSLFGRVAILGCSMPRPFDGLPPGKSALEPVLPVVVDRCSENYHEGKLEEKHMIEDEMCPIIPRLESLCDYVGAAVDYECRPAGDQHRVKSRHGVCRSRGREGRGGCGYERQLRAGARLWEVGVSNNKVLGAATVTRAITACSDGSISMR